MTPAESAGSLHIDCPTGLAGDMLLAGLLDLGVPMDVIETPLAQLGLKDRVRLDLEETRSGGLRGRRLSVVGLESDPPHRHWAEIRSQLQNAPLEPRLQQTVMAVFTALAEAEATVHGQTPESVHFHEVGAIDALVDVVGVCAAIHHLAPRQISCDPPPAGRGSVSTAHGVLPVPVPAVLELARVHQVPLRHDPSLPQGELTTPTGLALVSVLVDRFAAPPLFTPSAIGIGLGHRRLDRPNLVRLCLNQGEMDAEDPGPRWQPLVVQEAWIDDVSAEDIAELVGRLRQGGALDVATQSLLMKKGRAGVAVTVLVSTEQAPQLRRIWFEVGPSIGLRERQQGRWLLPRRAGTLATPWGLLEAKQVRRPDGRCTVKPEADALQRLSRASGCSVADLRTAAQAASFESEGSWTW